MFCEHTVVSATEKINDVVNKGCLGVIVYIYNIDLYEVEFFDDNNNTISIDTVTKNQIQEIVKFTISLDAMIEEIEKTFKMLL